MNDVSEAQQSLKENLLDSPQTPLSDDLNIENCQSMSIASPTSPITPTSPCSPFNTNNIIPEDEVLPLEDLAIIRRVRCEGDVNCWIIGDKKKLEAIIIDPGGRATECVRILNKDLKGYRVTHIWITHGHFDHIMHTDKLRKVLNAKVWLHAKDLSLYRALEAQLSLTGLKRRGARRKYRGRQLKDPDYFFQENVTMDFLDAVIFHTPGHTAGSCAFYFRKINLLVAGDTLMNNCIGRTDLPGGNSKALFKSVRGKIYKLPPSTRVLPGHGPETTIGFEMKNNRACPCSSYLTHGIPLGTKAADNELMDLDLDIKRKLIKKPRFLPATCCIIL